MSRSGPVDRARREASGIAALLVTGLWLSLMLAGFEYWLPVMLLGYIVVVPLVDILFVEDDDEERVNPYMPGQRQHEADHHQTGYRQRDTAGDEDTDASDEDEALQRLRKRYADGELTDDQFERKLERLLETESLEDVEDRHRERARGREREPEFE